MRYGRLIMLALLLTLAACAGPTIPTTATVDAVPTPAAGSAVAPPHYVLCSLDPVISYAEAKPGQVEDAANKLDSAETIGTVKQPARGTIRYHNAVVGAACK